MAKEMLINVAEGHECRIAVLEDGVLQELYIERTSAESHVGNIYKGRVTNVEPGIQAAFVDYGAPKNGFLHISDLMPTHFPSSRRGVEQVGKKRARYDRPPIQECLRRGQEVVVQVTKEGIGTKGSTLTTYLSIPGRFLVMMPGMSRLGVSRKIEDEQERRKLRDVLGELTLPEHMGFIIRTAGMDRAKKDLQNDLNYLVRLWRAVEKKQKAAKAPAVLYQESDLVIRTIRDIYSSEIAQITCDNERVAHKVVDFLTVVMPRGKHSVKLYQSPMPLFHRHGLEQEIERIYSRRVELSSGGSIVIDQTEAMVAIDVNSGRYREASNAEETAFRTNIAAAKEITRQLRLRDMGGVIVIDFIDMREEKHRREIERMVRDAVKYDRARTKILKISRFGLIEMTRQRVRPSLKHSIYRECQSCRGAGLIKSDESLALDVMRNLQLACANDALASIELSVAPSVAEYLNNRRRRHIAELETQTHKSISIRGDTGRAGDEVAFQCTDARGIVVSWDPAAAAAVRPAPEPMNEITAEPLKPEELTDVAEGLGLESLTEEAQEGTRAPAPAPLEAAEEEIEDREMAEGAEEPVQAVQPAPPGAAAATPSAPPDQGEAGSQAAGGRKRRRRHRGGRKHRRARERAAVVQGGQEAAQPAAVQPARPARPAKALVATSVQNQVEHAVTQSIEAVEEVENGVESSPQRPTPAAAQTQPTAPPAGRTTGRPAPTPTGPEEAAAEPVAAGAPAQEQPAEAEPAEGEPAKKKPSRRRGGRSGRSTRGGRGRGGKKKAAKKTPEEPKEADTTTPSTVEE